MTNEEINALTDPQINVMMTECIYDVHDHKHAAEVECVTLPNGLPLDVSNALYKVGNGISFYSVKDYCNDPAVMMPIVFANGISLIKTEIGEGWTACFAESWNGGWDLSFASNAFCEHTNPLRAAAIVYLKTKGVL